MNNYVLAQYRSKIYYIVILTCENPIHSQTSDLPKVMLEVSARNEGSHFSQEDQGILPLSITMLIILVVFLGQAVWGYYQEH